MYTQATRPPALDPIETENSDTYRPASTPEEAERRFNEMADRTEKLMREQGRANDRARGILEDRWSGEYVPRN